MAYKARVDGIVEMERLLTEHKNPDISGSKLLPYAPPKEPQQPQNHPIVFCHGFAWTEASKEERAGWQQVRVGHCLSLTATYPDCATTSIEVHVDKSENWPVVAAQVYAKQRRSLRGNLAFLDVDVVAFRRDEHIFDGDYDVGLTDSWEFWPLMPFNGGVIFAKDTPGAQLFFDRAMEYAGTVPANMPTWYAYQLALGLAYQRLKNDVKIKLFPKEEYNWTPEAFDPDAPAYFVHCKGARKHLFAQYVRAVLERAT